ncbi:hypothetical protein Aperf_G00000009467 [Anoplocephala perfoliata]
MAYEQKYWRSFIFFCLICLQIISRGLGHILAYLERNEPETIPPPPSLPKRNHLITHHEHLQQLPSRHEDENVTCGESSEDDPYETGVIFEEECTDPDAESSQFQEQISHSPTSFPFSLASSRPSSAMAGVSSQFASVHENSEWSEPDLSKRRFFRRLYSQPEFYDHVAMAAESSHESDLSITSLSDDEALSEKMNMERYRISSYNYERPMPPPRNNLSPSLNMGRSTLYVRRNTPSPPPRRPRLSLRMESLSSEDVSQISSPLPPPLPARQVPPLPAPRSLDARQTRIRPIFRSQRSFPPPTLRFDEASLHDRVWRVENTKIPSLSRQTTKTSMGYLSDDSESELSTDSSCEDLPVPRLRNHSSAFSAFPQSHFHSDLQPGQAVPPTTISNQLQHRYLKNGQGPAIAQPKANNTPQHLQQRLLHNEIIASPSSSTPSSYDLPVAPQAIYPQAQQYDELWRSTAENLRMILLSYLNINLPSNPAKLALELRSGVYLAQFINNFLGSKTVKRIYEMSGRSWQPRARQNLLSCREAMRNLGVPKHRLFSVTRVLSGDPTLGLFGLLHSLQTLMEIWASRPSTFLPGGLGVREKLTNQLTPKRSLIGDITTTRQLRQQRHLQDPHHHHHRNRTYSNPIFYPGIASGVFSDV